tara:strand:+ start:639 stop:767 length:129 start_codon:yes stop_codon:yes gene_type:complete
MIKKIIFFIFISILISSCGKKGDPVFKNQKSEKNNTKIVLVL